MQIQSKRYVLKVIQANSMYNLSPEPNIEINLPDNLRITKSYNNLKITRNQKNNNDYMIILEKNTLLPNGKKISMISNNDNNSNFCIKLNSEELSLPLYVRTRKDGDKMTIKNMTSPKKIKDIYIDNKLSKEERDSQPLVVDNKGEIIWIPGIKKSKFDKAKNENYDIILWYN